MNRDAPKPMRGSRVEKAPWQFSLRGLFVITAIVALCLGTGFYFPTAVAVVVACGLAQAAVVLAIDWLIRPRKNKRATRRPKDLADAAWLEKADQ